MPRPSKLTPEIQQKIGDGVSLGLTYALAASAAGVTYQTLNSWMKLGRDSTSGKYFEFYKHIEQRNAEGALKILQKLNDAAKAGNCQVCMLILERISVKTLEVGYIGKQMLFQKLNQNVIVDIAINDADGIQGTNSRKV